MENIKTILVSATVAALVVFILGGLVGNQPVELGSGTRFPNGLSADSTSPSAGEVRGTTLTITGAATLSGEITLGNCGTATWNPGSLASSSVDGISATTTDIAVPGAALGDSCIASLDSATSTSALFSCNISGTATGTITLANTGSAALDLATGTAKICYFD